MRNIDLIDLAEESWNPRELGPGATLKGAVVTVTEYENEYGVAPVLVVKAEGEPPRLLRWVAFGTVAQRELARQNPQPGDLIGVRYEGKPEGKNYDVFRIIIDRPDRPSQDVTAVPTDDLDAEAEPF